MRQRFALLLSVIGLAALLVAVVLSPGAGPADASGVSATAVSAGGSHTCALTAGGGVKCWGGNSVGQLGNGTTTPSDTPVDVTGLTSGVAAVSAGGGFVCALTTGGGVKCWGSNFYGQLGNNSACWPTCSTPVDVTGLTSGVAAVSSGHTHACALTTSGGVKCWGANNTAQLGDGTTVPADTPVDVSGMTSDILAVSGGGLHTCAITTGGGVKCWGYNGNAELGNGTSTGPDLCPAGAPCGTTPADVTGLTSGVAAVSASYHTCAITTDGGAKCWGRNQYGQLGNGTNSGPQTCGTDPFTFACSTTPVDVSDLTSGVAAVSAKESHTCAVTTTDGAKCWGYNAGGELGNSTTTDSSTAVDVTGLTSGVAAVSAGYAHTCALIAGGGVKCWGRNDSGQLGNGTNSGPQTCGTDPSTFACSTTPVDVAGLKAIATPAATETPTLPSEATATPTNTPLPPVDTPTTAPSDTETPPPTVSTATSTPTLMLPTDTPTFTNTPTVTRTPTRTPTPTTAPQNGDANGDGTTDAIDAAIVLQYVVGLVSSIDPSADVNDDGAISSIDAALILQYAAGLLSDLPV